MATTRESLEYVNHEYSKYTDRWTFWEDSIVGGENFLEKDYLIRHPREEDDMRAWLFRKQFAVYESFGRNIANDYMSRLFGPGVEINICDFKDTDETEMAYYQGITENADLLGNSFYGVMRNAIYDSLALGMSAVVCDVRSNGEVTSFTQAIDNGLRPYIRVVRPYNILDWAFDEYGVLEWVKIRELAEYPRTWNSPENSNFPFNDSLTPLQVYRYFVLDRQKIVRFDPVLNNGWSQTETQHGLGYVPFKSFYWRHQTPGYMFQQSILDEIYRTQFLIYQTKSGIAELIENQCFSIFIIAAGLTRKKDEELRIGLRRAIRVPGNEGFPPFFASPDADLPTVHMNFVQYLEKSIQRMSRASGITLVDDKVREASGRSKAYDVDGLTNLLRDAGDFLEPSVLSVEKMLHDRSIYADTPFTGRAKFPDSVILRGVLEESEDALAISRVLGESETAMKLLKQKFASTTLRSTARPDQLSEIYEELTGEPLEIDTKQEEINGPNGTNEPNHAVERDSSTGEQPGRRLKGYQPGRGDSAQSADDSE